MGFGGGVIAQLRAFIRQRGNGWAKGRAWSRNVLLGDIDYPAFAVPCDFTKPGHCGDGHCLSCAAWQFGPVTR